MGRREGMKCVLLAAGMGKRMGPLTEHLPKPLLPIVNRPILEHLIIHLKRFGVYDFYINVHYLKEEIIHAVQRIQQALGVNVVIREEQALTGPAGALLVFADLLQEEEDVLVLSGDGIHDADIRKFAEYHRAKHSNLTVLAKELDNAQHYGVIKLNETCEIIDFVEKPKVGSNEKKLVSCGVYCLKPKLLKFIPQGEVYDYVDLIRTSMRHNLKSYGYITDAYWNDIGTPERFYQTNADALMQKIQLTAENYANGLETQPSSSDYQHVQMIGPVLIGDKTVIGEGSVIIGPTVIGSHCVIGRNCYIDKTVMLPNCEVPNHTILIGGIAANKQQWRSVT